MPPELEETGKKSAGWWFLLFALAGFGFGAHSIVTQRSVVNFVDLLGGGFLAEPYPGDGLMEVSGEAAIVSGVGFALAGVASLVGWAGMRVSGEGEDGSRWANRIAWAILGLAGLCEGAAFVLHFRS